MDHAVSGVSPLAEALARAASLDWRLFPRK